MAAFRFLALLTVGFTLLALVFLLHVHQARLEREGTRELLGPEIALTAGESVTWLADLGGQRIEAAWPGEQRQPRLYVRGVPEGVQVAVTARYLQPTGQPTGQSTGLSVALERALMAAPQAGGPTLGARGENPDTLEPGTLEYGSLWLSWDHPLEITASVVGEPGEALPPARLVLSGRPSDNFVAARSMSRTLWAVFSIIGAAGFAGLLLTVLGGGSAATASGPSAPRPTP